MPRIARIRDVAASTAAAGYYTFAPHRMIESTRGGGSWKTAGRLAAIPTATVSGALAVLRAVGALPALVTEIRSVLDAVMLLVRRIDEVRAHADSTVDGVDIVCAEAEHSVRRARDLERRLTDLLDRIEPLLAAVAAVDTAAPAHAAALLARSGPMLDQIDTVLMPLLGELHDAVPDVRDILPVVQRLEPVMVDFETRMAGLPGSARMRRRGEQVIEDAQAENAEPDTGDRESV